MLVGAISAMYIGTITDASPTLMPIEAPRHERPHLGAEGREDGTRGEHARREEGDRTPAPPGGHASAGQCAEHGSDQQRTGDQALQERVVRDPHRPLEVQQSPGNHPGVVAEQQCADRAHRRGDVHRES